MEYQIVPLVKGKEHWAAILGLAPTISDELIAHLTIEFDDNLSDHYYVALVRNNPIGVLRFIEQELGEDEGRPPIYFNGKKLVEGKVIAFGVLPDFRNQGIGRALQEKAIEKARKIGCYQLRSRSDYKNEANYHLKISMGSGINPSLVDDSVYFIVVL